jgi:hypothetical protein
MGGASGFVLRRPDNAVANSFFAMLRYITNQD